MAKHFHVGRYQAFRGSTVSRAFKGNTTIITPFDALCDFLINYEPAMRLMRENFIQMGKHSGCAPINTPISQNAAAADWVLAWRSIGKMKYWSTDRARHFEQRSSKLVPSVRSLRKLLESIPAKKGPRKQRAQLGGLVTSGLWPELHYPARFYRAVMTP